TACDWHAPRRASSSGNGCRPRANGFLSTAPSGSIHPPMNTWKRAWHAPCATANRNSSSRCVVAAMKCPATNAGCSPPAGANRASGKMVRTAGLEQMLGFQGAEISPVSRWWEELIHPEDRALARPARVARAASADSDAESISCEYRVRHKSGDYVWIWDHCML